VSLFLMELTSLPPMRGERRTPLQLALRYVVTTWAQDAGAAHRLLGDLVAAAMQEEDFEVQLEPLSAEAWAALRAAPRPSFVLRVPVRQARPDPAVRLVRRPLVVQGGTLTRLFGVVLGPGDVALAGARVEIPAADVSTETDWRGRFHFPGIPAEPATRLVRVRARGRVLEVEVAQPSPDEPIVIRFDNLLEA
jgi:hypothetical protein